MKILLSAYACDPYRGSEERIGWGWALSLAARGHMVRVLTRASGKALLSGRLQAMSLPNLHFHFVDLPKSCHSLIKEGRNWRAHYLLWQRAALKKALSLDQSCQFDIVHHVTWGSLKGGSYLWRLNKPFVFGPVGGGQMAPAAFRRYFGYHWYAEAFRKLITRPALFRISNTGRTLSKAKLVLVCNSDTDSLVRLQRASRVKPFFDVGLDDNFVPNKFPS